MRELYLTASGLMVLLLFGGCAGKMEMNGVYSSHHIDDWGMSVTFSDSEDNYTGHIDLYNVDQTISFSFNPTIRNLPFKVRTGKENVKVDVVAAESGNSKIVFYLEHSIVVGHEIPSEPTNIIREFFEIPE